MDTSEWARILLLALSIIASAFFSASEASYLSIQRSKLAALMKTNPRQAERIDRLSSRPERLLSTVLTGTNLVNTAAAALATGIFLSFFTPDLAVLLSTVCMTVVLLIFAEAIPKTVATRHAEGVAARVAIPLRAAEILLLPGVWMLEKLVRGVVSIFNLPQTAIVSEEEIKALVDMGQEAGAVEAGQAEIIGQVFRIGDQKLRDIMTHRTEIVALDKGATLDEFLETYRQHPYARYPVCEGNIDSILGTVSLKEVVSAIAADEIHPGDDVSSLLTPAYFLPENRDIGSLIRQMQHSGQEMVILADEYGGVTGLVTFKQMVEEIVGPVSALPGLGDEVEMEEIDANTFLVVGDLHIDDANERLGMQIPEGDYETVAGFMLTKMGVIPQKGDRMYHGNFALEVTKVDGIKVKEVKVTRIAGAPEASI